MNAIFSRPVSLPGLRMQALEAGPAQGPLVLLLHGFPELSESWREVMGPLAEAGFRVVAPDMRGYGDTERPETGYDLDTLGMDVVHLARHLSPGRPVHLVGHDWGGIIAFHVAAHHPEVVDRLAVVNAPHPALLVRELTKPAQMLRSWYAFFFQLPWLPERLLSAGGGAQVSRMLRRQMVDESRVPPGKLAEYEAHFSRPEAVRPPITYYRELFRFLFTPGGRRRLLATPRARAPLMLIWGERDPALRTTFTQGLEPYFEQRPIVRRLPEEGHTLPLEAPDKVASLLLEHFRAARAPSGVERVDVRAREQERELHPPV
ncbi:alpha/beta fold hydrolase [Cystobacter fuscus]|uniref:alpha/beta fold hydrolase n=1 Tax=Cystobacter fuscus TaxID=43 RepID=UPI002B2AEA5C|nr:alpha/beta fold hydrolase [Cystobacter fuscus]